MSSDELPPRYKELHTVFDLPPYTRDNFAWTGCTVTAAASSLLRNLAQRPTPLIPLDFYILFCGMAKERTETSEDITASDMTRLVVENLQEAIKALSLVHR